MTFLLAVAGLAGSYFGTKGLIENASAHQSSRSKWWASAILLCAGLTVFWVAVHSIKPS